MDELVPHTTGRAEAWQAVLESDGYIRTSDIRSTVDEQGIRRAEFDMYYRNEQPEIALIHAIVTNTNARAAAGNEKYVGVGITESDQDRAERQQAAATATLQPRTGPTREQAAGEVTALRPANTDGVERQVIIRVDEVAPAEGTRGQAEAVKEALVASGAKVGEVQSTTDEQGIRHSEVKVSYRTDQPEVVQVSHALDAVAAQPGSQVIEHDSYRTERQNIVRTAQLDSSGRTHEISR